jgi:hypothetical protein
MRGFMILMLLLANIIPAHALTLDPRIAQPNFQYYWKDKTLVMLDHRGGNLHGELRNVHKARNADYQVVMAGWIMSSGTLWLGLPKSRFCIMPDAIFMFHQGGNRGRMAPLQDRLTYWNGLPKQVRNFILSQKVPAWKHPDPDSNLPWIDWIRVPGSQAIAAGFGRACDPGIKPNLFGGSHSDS